MFEVKIGINIQSNLIEYIKKITSEYKVNDIEVIYPNDKDYKKLEKYRKERELYPENYVSENSIKWD